MFNNKSVLGSKKLSKVEDAISDLKNGKIIIVVDDENRENEGDFIAAAEKVTPEMINFMATHGRGLICAPLTESRCQELKLDMMVKHNTVLHDTQFTVSVDLIGQGCTTGISVRDRAKTIKSLVNEKTKPEDLGRPGHIFPLKAKNGGVLRRTGHTEAAVDLSRLAGFKPAGILVEILNDDGTMARLPELLQVAKKFKLKIISIEDLVAYRMQNDSLIVKVSDYEINTVFGNLRLRAYKQTTNNAIHIALTKGSWKKNEVISTRINSTLASSEILLKLINKNDNDLDNIFNVINKRKKGALVFINLQSSSEKSIKQLEELKKIQKSTDIAKLPSFDMDTKDFGIGAQILHDLGIKKINLITNRKQKKRVGLVGYGLKIVSYISY
tara:strand:- start:98938 stop:100089 length:1152 start_codon:yes stop_codon:yes gene_type:complete